MTESRHWRYHYNLESESFTIKLEAPLASPLENQVLIKPLMIGVCGSDLSKIKHKLEQPALGHEWVGVVEAIGPEVETVTTGEIVTSVANVSCGKCDHCRSKNPEQCKKRQLLGTEHSVLSSQVLIYEHDLLKVSQDLDLASITLLEVAYVADCAFYKAKALGLNLSHKIVIFGAGPIGLMTALSFKERGYETHLIETQPGRIEAAARLGLTCSSFAQEMIERKLFSRCDTVIDCSGDSAGSGALKYLPIFSKMEASIVIVGKYHQATLSETDFGSKGLKVTWVANHQKDNFKKSIQFWQSRIKQYTPKIITHYPITEINKGFEAAKERHILKVMLQTEDKN